MLKKFIFVLLFVFAQTIFSAIDLPVCVNQTQYSYFGYDVTIQNTSSKTCFVSNDYITDTRNLNNLVFSSPLYLSEKNLGVFYNNFQNSFLVPFKNLPTHTAVESEIKASNLAVISQYNLSNYTLKIILPKRPEMRSDYGDVRFYDENNTKLSYYLEYYNSTHASFYVRFPYLKIGINYLRVTYGNPSLTSESNGYTTFPFFDDFQSGILNTSKFTDAFGTWSVVNLNGNYVLKNTQTANRYERIRLNYPYTLAQKNLSFGYKIKYGGGYFFASGHGWSASATDFNNGYILFFDIFSGNNNVIVYRMLNGTQTQIFNSPTNVSLTNWISVSTKKIGTTYTAYSWDNTILSTFSDQAVSPLYIFLAEVSAIDSEVDYYDDVFVREVVDPEPVALVINQTTITSANHLNITLNPSCSPSYICVNTTCTNTTKVSIRNEYPVIYFQGDNQTLSYTAQSENDSVPFSFNCTASGNVTKEKFYRYATFMENASEKFGSAKDERNIYIVRTDYNNQSKFINTTQLCKALIYYTTPTGIQQTIKPILTFYSGDSFYGYLRDYTNPSVAYLKNNTFVKIVDENTKNVFDVPPFTCADFTTIYTIPALFSFGETAQQTNKIYTRLNCVFSPFEKTFSYEIATTKDTTYRIETIDTSNITIKNTSQTSLEFSGSENTTGLSKILIYGDNIKLCSWDNSTKFFGSFIPSVAIFENNKFVNIFAILAFIFSLVLAVISPAAVFLSLFINDIFQIFDSTVAITYTIFALVIAVFLQSSLLERRLSLKMFGFYLALALALLFYLFGTSKNPVGIVSTQVNKSCLPELAFDSTTGIEEATENLLDAVKNSNLFDFLLGGVNFITQIILFIINSLSLLSTSLTNPLACISPQLHTAVSKITSIFLTGGIIYLMIKAYTLLSRQYQEV